MLPEVDSNYDDLKNEFEATTDLPTYTYKMLLDKDRVKGYTDGQEAMKQAIFKILQTERFVHSKVYSDNYGVELWELIGKPIAYVLPEIERRIIEALLQDDRITSVYHFDFEVVKSVVHVTFYADTIFGTVEIETGVNV